MSCFGADAMTRTLDLARLFTAFCVAPFAVACGGSVTAASGSVDSGADGAPALRGDAAAPSQAAADAGSVADAGAVAEVGAPRDAIACEYCFSHQLTWGYTGGYDAFVASSALEGCLLYKYSRTPTGTDPMAQTCSTDLSTCTGSSISTRDVDDALANPDVVAALAGNTLLYGSDPRPCDGNVLDIHVDDAGVQVGGDCVPDAGAGCGLSGSCTPVAPGLRALATLLTQLDEQELAIPPCSTTFP
jgi:hypothetical protein